MPAQKLTEAVIKKMPTPATRTDIRDAQSTGLYLRVYPSGRKTWRMRYQYHDKPRVLSLGEWPAMRLSEARQTVLEHHESLAEDSDPAGDVQRAKSIRKTMPTVSEFADEYVERHAKPNKKTWREDRRILNREVIPQIGKMRLDEVHRRDVVSIMDGIKDRGAKTAATMMLAVTRKMFHFAIERGVLDATPVQHIKAGKPTARDVVLIDAALRHFWQATEPYGTSETALPMHHATRGALRLLLLTGQRSSEVAGIRLDEIDLDGKVWTLPGSRTKNGRDQTVPLSDMAMEVIEVSLETAGAEYLFATSSESGHLTKWANVQAMERLFSGWEPRYRTHDLRRTVATRLSELGFNRLTVDKVLNHTDQTVGGVYDRHSYDHEKRQALCAWATLLQSVIDREKRAKVVSIT